MMRFAVMALIALTIYLSHSLSAPSGTLRYRLTVEVMVDDKAHTEVGWPS